MVLLYGYDPDEHIAGTKPVDGEYCDIEYRQV